MDGTDFGLDINVIPRFFFFFLFLVLYSTLDVCYVQYMGR